MAAPSRVRRKSAASSTAAAVRRCVLVRLGRIAVLLAVVA